MPLGIRACPVPQHSLLLLSVSLWYLLLHDICRLLPEDRNLVYGSLLKVAVSSSVCSGVYGLDMALGSPANGQGCVSVLQVVWCEVSRTGVFGSFDLPRPSPVSPS